MYINQQRRDKHDRLINHEGQQKKVLTLNRNKFKGQKQEGNHIIINKLCAWMGNWGRLNCKRISGTEGRVH